MKMVMVDGLGKAGNCLDFIARGLEINETTDFTEANGKDTEGAGGDDWIKTDMYGEYKVVTSPPSCQDGCNFTEAAEFCKSLKAHLPHIQNAEHEQAVVVRFTLALIAHI